MNEAVAGERAAVDFAPGALDALLRRRLGVAGELRLERIAGGQSNPT